MTAHDTIFGKTLNRRSAFKTAAAVGAAALVAGPALGLLSPASARSTDSLIVNTAGARLRSGPGTGYSTIASLAKGTEVRFLADGGYANGYQWYKVLVLATGKTGYVAAFLLSAPGGTPTGPFSIGQTVWVTASSGNMRAQPGIGATIVKVAPKGSQGVVVAGPVAADGYTWYQVTIGITTAWMATVALGANQPDAGSTGNVLVTDGPVNIRQYPTLSSAIIGTAQTGQRGWLTQRTLVDADGHRWAEVQFNIGRIVIGYVSTRFVAIS